MSSNPPHSEVTWAKKASGEFLRHLAFVTCREGDHSLIGVYPSEGMDAMTDPRPSGPQTGFLAHCRWGNIEADRSCNKKQRS